MQKQLEWKGWGTKAVAASNNRTRTVTQSAPETPASRSVRPVCRLREDWTRDYADTGAADPLDADVLRSCLRRIRSWRVPPNWSAQDWFGEMRSNSAAALWKAKCEYDPSRGVPLCAFERLRVIASAWTRYRQEWSYALHCPCDDSRIEPERRPALVSDSVPAAESVGELLAKLPEADRWLLQQLFWAERKEATVAQTLGVSQQAISKRLRVVLGILRCLLVDLPERGKASDGL
jgi:hypothetical protein